MRTEISCMRIAAAFAVVLLHMSAGVIFSGPGVNVSGEVFNCLGRWAVPLFVMISGALLLTDSKQESISRFYSKKAMKLVPPLLLWNVIYFRFMYWGAHLSVAQAADIAIYKGGFYWHLWYLPMALGLYLITPFVKPCIARCPRRILLAALALFLLAMSVYLLAAKDPFGDLPTIALCIPFLGYYVLGHCLNDVRVGKRTGWICLVLFLGAYACTLGANCLLGERSRFVHPFSPTVLVMCVSVFLMCQCWLRGRDWGHSQWLHRMAGTTLGIYLVHPLVIHTLHRFPISETRLPWLSIPLLAVLVFLISLALCLAWAQARSLVRHAWSAPRIERIATGVEYGVRNSRA